ncbi:MAG: aspartate carbamoyltransferase [Ignavibacteriae bacterium]|nr:aspartate carbamoyltransferase [Ignavibacteriota bacterium]
MKLSHVIESQQFTLPMLTELFQRAEQMERIVRRGGTQDYNHKIMASLFYEPSTRTRFSFESAMLRLGGKVISTESASTFSSVSLGETLEDTIRVVDDYADVIVLRHNEVGGAQRAAAVSSVSVINAGEGKGGGQHPTQALLDLYTIYKELHKLDGLKVAMVGNLADGRTVRSLSYLLGKFERVKIYFVAPPSLQMKSDLLNHLSEHNVWYTLETDLKQVLPEVDVVYVTRIERERFTGTDADFLSLMRRYFFDQATMQLLPQRVIVMHPLPRSSEIDPDVDKDNRAAYFRQAQNGVVIRMALLTWVLES